MIVFGDRYITSPTISKITNKEQIKQTKANSIIWFDFDTELLKYTFEQNIKCAVRIKSIKELIYCENLNATYIFTNRALSITAQQIANNYMYDCKILTIINSSDDLEQVALDQIDGAIYQELLD
jgi:hypothetical protein